MFPDADVRFANNVLDLVDPWPGFSVSEYKTGFARRGKGHGVRKGVKKGMNDNNYILPAGKVWRARACTIQRRNLLVFPALSYLLCSLNHKLELD